MSRTPFNWYSLDREILFDILNGARSQIVGRELLVEELHKILTKQVKKHLPIRVKMQRDASHEPGLLYIGGCYYSDCDRKRKDKFIEVVFSYFMFDRRITLSSYRWSRVCEVFADSILHEIIHMRQYRTRKFKNLPGYESTALLAKTRRNQNYYGHPDEIGAYSFNIACELYEKFGNDRRAVKKYLDGNQGLRTKRSTYLSYLRTFDTNHSVLKRLKKKVLYYLPYAEIGKPFKSPDYLTY